ncbi:MAG TPA: hypothetical protein VLK23_13330 [Thermodesulfobacteriota bacterium]|nr:hypothetical protein [Thermodesulfobacteriota bacterium]
MKKSKKGGIAMSKNFRLITPGLLATICLWGIAITPAAISQNFQRTSIVLLASECPGAILKHEGNWLSKRAMR